MSLVLGPRCVASCCSVFSSHGLPLQPFEFLSVLSLYCLLNIVDSCISCWTLRTGQNFRKLIKDGYVIRKPNAIHSRARVNKRLAAKRLGRHSGTGEYNSATALQPGEPGFAA